MLKPLQNRVFIELLEESKTTESGIVVPDSGDKKSIKGKVIALGEGKTSSDGKVIPMTVKVGDKVVFNEYSTTDIKIDGKEYRVLSEDDILAILD